LAQHQVHIPEQHRLANMAIKKLIICAPIPAHIKPEVVIQALHNPETLLVTQPLMQSWEKVENTKENNDIWFSRRNCTDNLVAPVTYMVAERIPLTPLFKTKLTKTIKFPALLQELPDGMRTKGEAPGGVTVWSEWKVHQKFGVNEWELVETTRVECNSALMGFVTRSLASAHEVVCKGVLKKAGVEIAEDGKDGDVKLHIEWSDNEEGNWMGIGFA
jgi:hypothetical protein